MLVEINVTVEIPEGGDADIAAEAIDLFIEKGREAVWDLKCAKLLSEYEIQFLNYYPKPCWPR